MDQLARERFIKERNLGDIDPACFRVRMDLGELQTSLDIPAGSPWDAEAVYRSFNGISSTTGVFTTGLVEEGQEGSGAERRE